ncbi:non-ribosomal peptide synthetase [Gracilaria domingensis]|nr:non-ribosomal peptide synthetase [Gracilaria domingensis]
MVPGFYVELEELPLTPNGKVDRRKLPGVDGDDLVRNEYVGPRNDIERRLVAIWEEVLGLERISVTDNFFDLGGHSLLAVQVINKLSKQFNKTISFTVLFENPTIGALGVKLEDGTSTLPSHSEGGCHGIVSLDALAAAALGFEPDGRGSLAYNMPGAVRLKGSVDGDMFEGSFRRLIARHEILRTSIRTNQDDTIRHLSSDVEGDVGKYLEEMNGVPFDLERAPLVSASLIKIAEEEFIFFLSLHHIIGDGGRSRSSRAWHPVQGLCVWLEDELQRERQQSSEKYWLEQFEGELPVLDIRALRQVLGGLKVLFTRSGRHPFHDLDGGCEHPVVQIHGPADIIVVPR